MKNLPKAMTFPQFPIITAYGDDDEEEEDVFIGDIAEQYLRRIRHFEYEIRMVSFTLGTRKQK